MVGWEASLTLVVHMVALMHTSRPIRFRPERRSWKRLASAEAQLEGLTFLKNLDSMSARAVMSRVDYMYLLTPLTRVYHIVLARVGFE